VLFCLDRLPAWDGHMSLRRREFIPLLGGAAAWPLALSAQEGSTVPVIGYLESAGVSPDSTNFDHFRKALAQAGYVEGRNVAIEFRRADNQYDRLPALAAELVNRGVAVIFASTSNAAQAAKGATARIPIVFRTGGDPVRLGLVASYARPGGNVTGISFFSGELVAKRLQFIRELVPQARLIAFLTNPKNDLSEGDTMNVQAAARNVDQEIVVLTAAGESEINLAFAAAAERRVGAMLVDVDIFFGRRRDQLIGLAARYGIPASYSDRLYVAAGGLMSYGDDSLEGSYQAGSYVSRILKGEMPSELPVGRPSKFVFAINLKTAKALGLALPRLLLAQATELIE
jgi:ABC-type uncharacterized transport system substrate-binding protein